jgi:hypothetical protein
MSEKGRDLSDASAEVMATLRLLREGMGLRSEMCPTEMGAGQGRRSVGADPPGRGVLVVRSVWSCALLERTMRIRD